MNNELSNLILIFDSREKSEKRIKYVKDWFESGGGIVEKAALPLCDYKVVGEFHDVPVNLGVEFKTMPDFCSSWQDLKDKLGRARNELYDEVALCVDAGNYSYTYQDGKAFIHNPAIRNGDADVCPLAIYEGLIDTLQQSGIHVRQLRSEAQFPDSLYNLLTYITNEHELIGFTGKGYIPAYKRVLQELDGVGFKTVEKLIASYPNLSWLSSACEDSLIEVIGKKSGSKLYSFLHCHELETDAWRNGHHFDGTQRLRCPDGKTICDQNAYECVKGLCPHFDNFSKKDEKLATRQSQDNEGRLAFDAPAKNPIQTSETNEWACKGCENEIDCTPVDFATCQGDGYSPKNPVKSCDCGHVFHAIGLVTCPKCGKRQFISGNICDFADDKNRTECKTPDHFKNSSHSGKDINSVEHGISPHPSLPDDKLSSHLPEDNSKVRLLPRSQSSGSDNSRVGKPESSHVAHNHKTAGLNPVPASKSSSNSLAARPSDGKPKRPDKYGVAIAHDISQSSDSILNPLSTPQRSGDPQSLPPKELKSGEKQGVLSVPPATNDMDIGLDDKPLECVVKCRACHQVIIPEQDDDTGFCNSPVCIAERAKPKQKMNLKETIKDFMAEGKPHLMQEIVDTCDGWSPGYVFEHIMGAVKSGYFKKITEQNGRNTFQKVN